MKTKSQKLRDQLAHKYEAIKAILDKEDEAVTPEELASVKTMQGEVATLKSDIADSEEMEALAVEAGEGIKSLNAPATKHVQTKTGTELAKVTMNFPALSSVKSFKGERDGKAAVERAYRFGKWIAAAIGVQSAVNFCNENGMALKAHTESVNTAGGYLVPEEFDADLIDLREQYGVFRQNVKISPMSRDTKVIPRRSGGMTAYYVGENASITESSKSWNRVRLTAKKLACLAKYSSELDEDSILNMGDDLAGEIAYAFANAEDNAGFNGDATSTYGGILGLAQAFYNIPGGGATVSSISGLYAMAATGGWNSAVLADFNNTKAKLPQYAIMRGNAKWFVSQAFWSSVMERLALAAGGVTSLEIVSGAGTPRFLGFPVVISQVMPVVTAVSQICAYLGDLNLAAVMGDRRQTTIAFSEHLNFAEDEIAIRGTERFDINVHDVGNYTATASAQVPGPIVALITATS